MNHSVIISGLRLAEMWFGQCVLMIRLCCVVYACVNET